MIMAKCGVFKRARRSAARGRQILGARWVYKRKANRFDKVYRYRARLVAQGHLQKEYDRWIVFARGAQKFVTGFPRPVRGRVS